MRGWFFEGFEEGVEGSSGEHVNLINVDDAETAAGGSEAHGLEERADFVDFVVGGTIDFEDIERAAFCDFDAEWVIGIELDGGAFWAIEGF